MYTLKKGPSFPAKSMMNVPGPIHQTKKLSALLWDEGAHLRRCRVGLVHTPLTTPAKAHDVNQA